METIMKKLILSALLLSISPILFANEAPTKNIMISAGVQSIDLKHDGKKVTLMRNQSRSSEIIDFYKPTHRGKIQPMHPFKPHQVETLGELEMIAYLKQFSAGDHSIIIIDSRTQAWVKRSGMIPGAVNIPFTEFKSTENSRDIMEDRFDVLAGETFDFSNAKTLVMYCNGIWCGQSPTAIKKLLSMGYPAAKIKYYRGGMHSWAALGLTVIKD
jgi:rhodanese-related sulfurtransferase